MSNALAGFTGLKSAGLKGDREGRWLSILIAGELLRVARALGVSVEPISGVPASMFLEANEDGAKREEVEQKMVGLLYTSDAAATPYV